MSVDLTQTLLLGRLPGLFQPVRCGRRGEGADAVLFLGRLDLGEVYAVPGRVEEAIQQFRTAVDDTLGNPYAVGYLRYAYGLAGFRARWLLDTRPVPDSPCKRWAVTGLHIWLGRSRPEEPEGP